MRSVRRLVHDDRKYEARVPWRSSSGLGLCFFVALDSEVPAEADRADRRAALERGQNLDSMSDAELAERLETGSVLTNTERRFEAPDGESWLAQNIGPVWAEGAAAGLTGVLFTSLSGSGQRWRTAAGHIGALRASELVGLLNEARSEPQTPQ
jgi:hypothetical protein